MFKSILNSIQKNVIGATIFGKPPTMSTTDTADTTDETIPAEPIPLIDVNDDPNSLDPLNSSTEENENTADALADCEDPLCDPLALDDSTELGDGADKTLTDLKSTDGQIILIDVNLLRNVEQTELLSSRDIQTEDLSETIEEGVPSDGSDSGVDVVSDGSIIGVRPQTPEIVTKRSCLKRRSSDSILNDNSKRAKRNIKFDGVNVFYFQRQQGNSCVPSQGGCTLGMARHHMHNRTFSLAEHAAEQRRLHRLQDMNANNSSTDDTDTEDEPSENSGSDLDMESNAFLQPVPARQRRVMLKTAGVLKIDTNEKDECRKIRTSREMCGCSCRGYCDPDTCVCSQSGIKCQVDRLNFPCGCSRHGCDNVRGRVEFDPERVRIHFIHTILRLELENKQNRSEEIVFKNDVSRQWHPQNRPPDITTATTTTTTNGISEFSNCNYNSVGFDNLSHRSSTSSVAVADRSIKDYDRVGPSSMPSHSNSSNLIELANRPSDVDTLNLHYDYRNDNFTPDSIVNTNVVANCTDKGQDVGMVNSFNSTFNEFLERTYNLGGSDYQHHSAYLSPSHSGSTSSGIVDPSNIVNIPYDLCDEPISDNIATTSVNQDKKSVDVVPEMSNETLVRNSSIETNDSDNRELDDSVQTNVIDELLNNEIDVEEEIPSVMVAVENNKICENAKNGIEDDFTLTVCDV